MATQPQAQRRTPLPKTQVAVTFLIQFAEPITATVIYPFAPEAVRRTGVAKTEKQVGYYAGVVESVFFLMECLSVYPWGRASDKFGRRPVLLLGPLGLAIGTYCFGLSKAFWALVFFRGLQGIFNGNIGVSKTVMAELTDSTNIGVIFSIAPILWSIGVTLGNSIGGVFSNPATKWPDSLGKIHLLQEYPYFLPCAISGTFAFLAFAFAFVAFKETSPIILERRRLAAKQHDPSIRALLTEGDVHDYGAINSTAASPEEEGKQSKFQQLMSSERYPITLLSYCFLAFGDMCFASLIPLVYSTPIRYGGLGFTPNTIGTIMAANGIFAGLIALIVYSRLLERFGPRTMLRTFFVAQMVIICAFPCMAYFAQKAGRVDATVWAILVGQLAIYSLLYPAYSSIGILIVDAAPTPDTLASANSVAQMTVCGLRTFAPSTALSLFSLSLEKNLLGGNLVYALLLCFSATAVLVSSRIPKTTKMGSQN